MNPLSSATLSQEQRESARRVSERLRSEFGALLAALPLETRTIATVSEHLGITPPVCQRLLRGVRLRTPDSITALPAFPGVRGLRQVIAAARERRMHDEILDRCERVVVAYAHLIESLGGSQTQLIETLRNDDAAGAGPLVDDGPGETVATRRAIFEAQRRITRREMATQLAVFMYRPRPEDPLRMDCVTAMGMLGMRREADSLPLCLTTSFAFGDEVDDPTERIPGPIRSGDWQGPVGVLERFSSDPAPSFVSRRSGRRIPLLLDPDETSLRPTDIVLGTRIRDIPSSHTSPSHAPSRPAQYSSLISEGPARQLVLQVHLHRTLARQSVAAVDAYSVGARGRVGDMHQGPEGRLFLDRPEDRWFDRLPDRPRLDYLGVGLDRVDAAPWERLPELTENLFELSGWDPEEFIAYRTVVRYPVWGAQYLMSFDFGSDPE